MSYRISYHQLAVRFPADVLNQSAPNEKLKYFGDQYILLELGGDNNLWGQNPYTGADARHRSWSVIALGEDWIAMENIVRLSAPAESGGLKMYGRSKTLPETYIRRYRSVIHDAVTPEEAVRDLSMRVNFSLDNTLISETSRSDALTDETCEGKERIYINPLDDMFDAVKLFHTRKIFSSPWAYSNADGPCFKQAHSIMLSHL